MNFAHLTPATRDLMADEIETDITSGTLYVSHRLTKDGKAQWTDNLLEAAHHGTPRSLKESMANAFQESTPDNKPMPRSAAKMLCYNEFNRYYMRAVCRQAQRHVVAYRAMEDDPRSLPSERAIGRKFSAQGLLVHLRSNSYIGDALHGRLGLGGSGLSVKFPPETES